MPIHSVINDRGEKVWECYECEVCGHFWLPVVLSAARLPVNCPSRHCRTQTWNGKRGICGPEGKGAIIKAKTLPWSSGDGHHPLCPCVLCLSDIKIEAPKRGRPKGKAGTMTGEGRERVRDNLRGAREKRWGRGKVSQRTSEAEPQEPCDGSLSLLLSVNGGAAGGG